VPFFPVEALTLALPPAVVLPEEFFVVLPLVGLLLVGLLLVWFPARLAVAAMVPLADELPELVDAFVRVVRNEPRTASSSSWACAMTTAPEMSASVKSVVNILKRI